MRSSLFVVALLIAATSVAVCQEALTSDQIKKILDVSQRRGQLAMEGTPPFHLVASYEWVDGSGRVLDTGSFEEIWAGPKRYRQLLVIAGQQLLEVDNGKQAWRSGQWVMSAMVDFGSRYVLTPFFERPPAGGLSAGTPPRESPNLDCFATQPELSGVSPDIPLAQTTYCLEKGNHLLRYIFRPNNIGITFNSIEPFAGNYIARKVQIQAANGEQLRVHLDRLESEADFSSLEAPLSDSAQLLSFHRADVPYNSTELMHAQPLKPIGIDYPPGSSGRVVVKVHIDTTGVVTSAEVISADNLLLRGPAIRAAKQWRFRAAYQSGKVIEDYKVISFVPSGYSSD